METSSGRKVAEAVNDAVVVEIWQKDTEGKTYFDVQCKAEAVAGESRYLSMFLRGNDIPSLVIAVIRAMEFISVYHREARQFGGGWQMSGTMDIATSWVDPAKDAEDDGEASTYRQIKEIKCGAVVTELYDMGEGSDVAIRCRREFPSAGSWKRSPYIQQRDLRDLIISVTEMWKHLIHPAEGNVSGIQGGFYQE